MTDQIKSPRKLIEVALPLDDINIASTKEKSIRHGHPSTLHLWWARRPLATARAVLFAQMVNDPGYERILGRGVNMKDAAVERERLFGIIRRLVLWENTNNEDVLKEARDEIVKSWRETCQLNKAHSQAAKIFNPDKLPTFHDPFAGGGSLPLEAQRLGLQACASDLNPVAVLINKAMIEIPPIFAARPPVSPESRNRTDHSGSWKGTQGLAADVRYYGQWMRAEAEKRIGHLYPKALVTAEMAKERPDLKPYVGKSLTVIAWLWARTVKSPNPAFGQVDVPLVSTFMLSTTAGKEAYVEPVLMNEGYSFKVSVGKPRDPLSAKRGTKSGSSGSSFLCLMSGTPMSFDYLRAEAKDGRMGARLMAVVAEVERGRVYLSATPEMESIALSATVTNAPETALPAKALGFRVQEYGMTRWRDLFTIRQLVALTTFSDLVQEARERVKTDAVDSGMPKDETPLAASGTGAAAYADAVSVFLGFSGSRMADRHSSLCRWDPNPSGYAPKIANTFGRHALPMVWDYVEGNPFSPSTGNFLDAVGWVIKVIETALPASPAGVAVQADARLQDLSMTSVVSTDPPYYDNIGYADLSDFFYVWLRRSLKPVFPDLFATLAVPKSEELVATPYRHGSKERAQTFFLDGMTQAMHRLAEQAHPAFPVTIYYAFKQAESDANDGTTNTGWDTFLAAVIEAGFAISGTWPMRTELGNRMIGSGTNALASSIVLVCRPRDVAAPTISRREYIRELNAVLPEALVDMTRGETNSPVAAVDLSQAIIGPGMAVFSKYAAVLEADGTPMKVRTALQLINRFLAEDDFDHETQFCLHWFDANGWDEGKFGVADVLARAKGTSVNGVAQSGVVESGQGSVRLLRYSEYPSDWSPESDTRTPVWEALHHLIRALQTGGGESVAGELLARMPTRTESIRQLGYRLYTLCERKGWAEDARAYNELINSWQGIEVASQAAGHAGEQTKLDLGIQG